MSYLTEYEKGKLERESLRDSDSLLYQYQDRGLINPDLIEDPRKIRPAKVSPKEIFKEFPGALAEKFYLENIKSPINAGIEHFEEIEGKIGEGLNLLMEVALEQDSFVVGQVRRFLFGVTKEVYSVFKELVLGCWTLLQFGIELSYDSELQAQFQSHLDGFTGLVKKLIFGNEVERQDSVLRLKNLGNLLSSSIAQHYTKEWEKAKSEEKEAEFIGKLLVDGVLVLEGGANALSGAKTAGKAGRQITEKTLELSKKMGTQTVQNLSEFRLQISTYISKNGSKVSQVLEKRPRLRKGRKRPLLPEPKKTPADLAKTWQGSGDYPGVDRWKNGTLKEGTLIYGGVPGQGSFYTMKSTVRKSQLDADKIFKGLQVKARRKVLPDGTEVYTHRDGLMIYRVKQETPAAFALSTKNLEHGEGGYGQIFIENFKEALEPVERLQLHNTIADFLK